jgi:hypothetical protein
MGAIQAQDFNMAKWAVGIRAADSTEQAILDAFNRGDFLRTHVMRPTWHFVATEDIRWMCALSERRLKSALRVNDSRMGITEELYGKVADLLRSVLKGGNHLSAKELTVILEDSGVDTAQHQLYHYLMHAEASALICSGKMRGSTQTYALLDERVAPQAPLPREEAIAKLARMYLQSHSPARLDDFIWWSLLSKTEARNGFASLGNAVDKIGFAGQEYCILRQEGEGNPATASRGAALLLPAFDEYIIAYSDRDTVVAKEHQSQAFTSNGIFKPTIAAQGKVVGTWRKGSSDKKNIEVAYFAPPSKALESQVAKAAKHFVGSWQQAKVKQDL